MSETPFIIKVDASGLQKTVDEIVKKAVERAADIENDIIMKMLCEWVSELEPVIVRQNSSTWVEGGTIISSEWNTIVGLTAVGHDQIVVRRRP